MRTLRKNLKAGVKEFGKGEFDEKIWKTFSEGIFSTDVEYDDKDSYRRLKEKIETIDTDPQNRGKPALLPRNPARGIRNGRNQHRRSGSAQKEEKLKLDAHHSRETYRL
jgi:hypothetical protein